MEVRLKTQTKTMFYGALTASLKENVLTGFEWVAEWPDGPCIKIMLALTCRRAWNENGLELRAEVGGCCRNPMDEGNRGYGTEAGEKYRGSKVWPAGHRNEVKGRTKGSLRKSGSAVLPLNEKRNNGRRVTIIFIERERYSLTKLTEGVQLIQPECSEW